MKILVTGGNGLLAYSLRQLAPGDAELVFLDLPEFDLTQPDMMAKWLDELRPGVVINTAAYNLVDRCEQERKLSWAVNAEGPKALARLCAARGCRLVHYGSDYVFDGAKRAPYFETDETNPINYYGAGKLAGETAVLTSSPRNLVLRTSWLFGPHPTQAKSYVHTVLHSARSGAALKATTDQVAVPTYAPDLARWTWELVKHDASGLFHAVNDDGVSRYEWTEAILAAAQRTGLLNIEIAVEPALTAFFNPTMRRPAYSVLDNQKAAACLGKPLRSWRIGLEAMLLQWRSWQESLPHSWRKEDASSCPSGEA
jgi:dTDP-4-dehydrorhamnose reductase